MDIGNDGMDIQNIMADVGNGHAGARNATKTAIIGCMCVGPKFGLDPVEVQSPGSNSFFLWKSHFIYPV